MGPAVRLNRPRPPRPRRWPPLEIRTLSARAEDRLIERHATRSPRDRRREPYFEVLIRGSAQHVRAVYHHQPTEDRRVWPLRQPSMSTRAFEMTSTREGVRPAQLRWTRGEVGSAANRCGLTSSWPAPARPQTRLAGQAVANRWLLALERLAIPAPLVVRTRR
jgi:hypothetical protein